MPFLTVITRTYKRPNLLANNQRAFAEQTDPDYEQIIIRDEVGVGVAAANVRLRGTAGCVRGEYVLVIDDDDIVVDPGLIADLKRLAVTRPGVIMVRWDHGPRGVLPAEEWFEHGGVPPKAGVGGGAPIVRADVYRALCHTWGNAYDGDHDFVSSVLTCGQPVVWHNKVVCAVQQIGLGRPEENA